MSETDPIDTARVDTTRPDTTQHTTRPETTRRDTTGPERTLPGGRAHPGTTPLGTAPPDTADAGTADDTTSGGPQAIRPASARAAATSTTASRSPVVTGRQAAPDGRVPLDVAVGARTVAAEPWVMWETLIAAVQRWTVQPADALRNCHGISVYDYRLLRLLARAPRPMRKAIANTALDLPPRSLDHSVTRLADRGYLTVTGRGNEKRLALTDFGIEFLEAVIDTLRTVTSDSLPSTALPPRDRAVLVTLLNRLRR
ncbi:MULTISPECIES: MarR family winged helix-turn-helix transcriptional regulator [Actinoalloteichus]|uniref:Uncharacterized protein n=1 Tax=Actinoalloteichus fjordicus TaxID=1612552 RepID=A0AAC9L7U6_9PSEU|nr:MULTISPECIES: hypothetical protein [Actinoalloteichus]APU12496.1 hypothetical protein UA74_02045 [Actinoalloteichus fjordicus]APU18449.1 hypothetical protein UA75_02050 [Actinoalloteichus sp. GBA129-24]